MCTESLRSGDQLSKFLMICETDWESGGEEEHNNNNNNNSPSCLKANTYLDRNQQHSPTFKGQVHNEKKDESVSAVREEGEAEQNGDLDKPSNNQNPFSEESNGKELEVKSSDDESSDGDFIVVSDGEDPVTDLLIVGEEVWPHRCPICSETIPDVETFFQHSAKHQQENLETCKICTLGFTRVHDLEEHKKNHNEFGSESTVLVLSNIIDSIDTRIQKKSTFKCSKCKQSFDTAQTLKEHVDNHPDTKVMCVLCEQKFSKQEFLMKHISKMHKNGKPFCCIYCQADCVSMSDLRSHLESHRNVIDMVCSLCERSFTYRRDYDRHVKTHLRPKTPIYQCSLCGHQFKSAELLTSHTKQHESLPLGSCVTCEKVFPSTEALKAHMVEHKLHRCRFCERKFFHRSDLRRHIEMHKLKESEKQETVCPVCLTDFLSVYKLKRHMLTHRSEESSHKEPVPDHTSGDKPTVQSITSSKRASTPASRSVKSYSCPDCTQTFTSKKDLESHQKNHPIVCSPCNQQFPDQRALSFHLKDVHIASNIPIQRDTFLCNVCGLTFFTKKGLRNHMYEHTGESRQHVCHICHRGMNSSTLLEEHMRRHRGEKPFMCDQCAKQFTTRSGLKIHQQCHSSERPHVCPVCNRGFARAGSLRTHMSVHTGNRPYGCTICPKTFHQESSLMEHLKMHSGVKPFVCNVCQKRFSLQQYLKQHEKIHKAERQHKCLDCEKRFATPQGLYQHSKTHRSRPFHCSHCDRRFTHMQTLRLHISTHSGDRGRRYACQICDKSFSTPQGLYQHRRIHRDGAFSCDHCAMTFGKFRQLREHLNTHREDVMIQVGEKDGGQVGNNGYDSQSRIRGAGGAGGGGGGQAEALTLAQSDMTDFLYQYQVVEEQPSTVPVPPDDATSTENTHHNDLLLNETIYNSSSSINVSELYNPPGPAAGNEACKETTVYYEPTAGLLFFEQPELAQGLIQDDLVQQSLREINQDMENAQTECDRGTSSCHDTSHHSIPAAESCPDSHQQHGYSQQPVNLTGHGARLNNELVGHQEVVHQEVGHQEVGQQKIGHHGVGHQEVGHLQVSQQKIVHQEVGHQEVGQQDVVNGQHSVHSGADLFVDEPMNLSSNVSGGRMDTGEAGLYHYTEPDLSQLMGAVYQPHTLQHTVNHYKPYQHGATYITSTVGPSLPRGGAVEMSGGYDAQYGSDISDNDSEDWVIVGDQ